jgi:uncharacterized protein YjlB
VIEPEHWMLNAHGWVPNNPYLPVLFYAAVLDAPDDLAAHTEELFRKNGWTGTWLNGVFDYQHFHTNAHEVLAFVEGSATLMIGGPKGKTVNVYAGDVIVLPAGTGHCRIEASPDFLVVGAYPPNQEADICRDDQGVTGLQRIKRVTLPETDPLYGAAGPLVSAWRTNVRMDYRTEE